MRRVLLGCAAAAAALGLVSCGAARSPGPSSSGWSRPGPYAVGATTLDLGPAGSLGERMAEVFYPADRARLAGHPQYRYRLADPLPQAALAFVPQKYNSLVSSTARVDAPGSRAGPFPVVLFSHGYGASRLYYSKLLVGIASWGYVVVSADYLERGLLAQATHATVTDSPAQDLRTMLASLDAAEQASGSPSSPLSGTVDGTRVAAAGHSSGGETAFDALSDPRVAVAIGWAPEGPTATPPRKPATIIGALGDVGLTPAMLTREYEAYPGPVTFVEISNEGHNTFTDLCPAIRDGGGGLVGYAISLHLISGELATLAENGCTQRNIPADRFWPIVQDYTVASLRHAFGSTRQPPAEAVDPTGFAGITVSVRHRN